MSGPVTQFRGPYAFLSNFYQSAIPARPTLERFGLADGDGDVTFPTVEHGFQACKASTRGDMLWVLGAPTPGSAKRRGSPGGEWVPGLGERRKIELREDWESIKVTVMLACLRAKFAPGTELASRLLHETGYRELVEGNTWGDRYWGKVCDGITTEPVLAHEVRNPMRRGTEQWSGRNMLGRCLMLVRAELDVYATTGTEWRS